MSQDPQYQNPAPYRGGQQPGYGPPGYYPAPRGTNTMAILALVFAFLFWPLAIVFGHIAHRQIRETGEEGRGLATAGLVLGYVFLVLTLLVIVLVVIAGAIAVSVDPSLQ